MKSAFILISLLAFLLFVPEPRAFSQSAADSDSFFVSRDAIAKLSFPWEQPNSVSKFPVLPFWMAGDIDDDANGIKPQKKRFVTAPRMLASGGTVSGLSETVGFFSMLFATDPIFFNALLNKGPQKVDDGKTFAFADTPPAEFNGDVRALPQVPVQPHDELELNEPVSTKKAPAGKTRRPGAITIPAAPMPAFIQNFPGLSLNSVVTGGSAGSGWPPDINGDVGLNNYIEAVNDAFAIYSKTGTLQASFTENSLFSGGPTGTVCDAHSAGDPVVVYDQFADRWFLTNFAFAFSGSNPVSPFFECIAVSKTSDPVAGGWWLYAVRMDPGTAGTPPVSALNDYPKFGNWNDGCLYMSANEFQYPAGSFAGTAFASFSKSAMESGTLLNGSNSSIGYAANTSDPFTLMPSNITGAKAAASLPPPGTPDYFVSESGTAFNFEVRKFTPGAGCGTGGTLGAATNVSQTAYTVPGVSIVPQPPPATGSNLLDSLDDRLMQKAQYRKVGAAESLWVTHTFRSSSSGPTGSQWAEIDVSGGTVVTTPVQQELYDPADGIYRWMSSVAADRLGDMALGYSKSNATSPNFPSAAYAGRLVGDTANTLPQTETQFITGLGSQVNNCGAGPCHRWGDYTAMSVDPTDDCTFWYTNEYYDTQTSGNIGNWHTQIVSFKFPTCTVVTAASAGIAGRVTLSDGRGVRNVVIQIVSADGSVNLSTRTGPFGYYRFPDLPTGASYIISVSARHFTFNPSSIIYDHVDAISNLDFTALP